MKNEDIIATYFPKLKDEVDKLTMLKIEALMIRSRLDQIEKP